MKRIIFSSSIVTVSVILVVGAAWAPKPPETPGKILARIEALEARVGTLEADLAAARNKIDDLEDALDAEIAAREGAHADLLDALAAEIEARRDADTALQAGIIPNLGTYLTIEEEEIINGVVGPHVIFTGANVHIRSGSDANATDDGGTLTGLGNLIVGYNEDGTAGPPSADVRSSSHNIVVGKEHYFSSFGGLVAGASNYISAPYASVTGGHRNTASGIYSSVSGGGGNTASGPYSNVSGGLENTAIGNYSNVSGGQGNTASGGASNVSGGQGNTASGGASNVSGGGVNTASGNYSSVSGGWENEASGGVSSVSGGRWNKASGPYSSVSGGGVNEASGIYSSVSGGDNISIGSHEWAAGSLVDTLTALTINKFGTVDIASGGPLNLTGSIINLNGGGRPVSGVGDKVIALSMPGTIITGSPSVFIPPIIP